MKIVHTADLHLDSNMESNLDKEQARQRKAELLDTFEDMVNYASDIGAGIFMISGDMFDKNMPAKRAMRRVLDIMGANPGIDFLYLKGNHDSETFDSELKAELLPNLYMFTSKEWTQYDYGEVVISGRELNDDNSNSLYSDLVLDVAKINIVMLHGQEATYEGADKTHIVNLKNLKNKYIDYLALGHIHKYKTDKLDERGTYCYPGCPEPRGFDECGQKGFVVLDIDINTKTINSEFVSVQKRLFIEREIEVTPEMDLSAVNKKIEDSISDIDKKNAVKLVMTGYTDMERDLDVDRIKDRFFDRFFFLKVYDKTRAQIDYESFAYDRTLKGTFVRLLQKADIPDENKADIIEAGIRAIMGEEIER